MKILFIHNKYKQYGGEDVAVELETAVLIRPEKKSDVGVARRLNAGSDGIFRSDLYHVSLRF